MREKKKFLLFSLLFFFFLFLGFAYGGWTLTPFKITDPEAVGFNPYRFKFEDYQNDTKEAGTKLDNTLKHVLKPGMNIENVDKILVESGGAKKTLTQKHKNEIEYWYFYRPWYFDVSFGNDYTGWNIFLLFDKYNNLEKFEALKVR